VDWGARRIGLAISDPDGIIATGLETLQVKTIALAVQAVADTAAAQGAASIVVGLPLLMSGERGEAAHAAESFARDLSAVEGGALAVDERVLGVAVAAIAIWRKAPLLLVVILATVTTALARALL